MFISTGLKPTVKRVGVQKVEKPLSISLSHISGQFPIPTSAAEVWIVELATVKDTQLEPRGTIKEVLILSKEPKIEHRSVKLSATTEQLYIDKHYGDEQYERAKRHYHIPSDAVQETHYLGAFHMKETVISWYEIGV